jgi:hypothetical protein
MGFRGGWVGVELEQIMPANKLCRPNT